MEKPSPEIISLKAQIRDLIENVQRLEISIHDVQIQLLKIKK